MNNKIFISLAAFCEPFLEFTMKDALSKAKCPENLFFGVVDQHTENRRKQVEEWVLDPKQLSYVHIDPVESRGVSWARSLVNSLVKDERFYLQIDSHTFFEENWDVSLIQSLSALNVLVPKPVLSVYPYGFEFDECMKPKISNNPSDRTTLALRVHPETELSTDNVVLRFRAEHVMQKAYVNGFHLAGGFIFTYREFVDEVPYDPYFYFHGEEQGLAIRAFTRGWNIYHPPFIPLYHLYKAPNQSHQNHHWHTDWNEQRHYDWGDLKRRAALRLNQLLNNELKGSFGLGCERNLTDFYNLSGIDYANRSVNREHNFEKVSEYALIPYL